MILPIVVKTDYDTLCERGRNAVQEMDTWRWELGLLAVQVEKGYGEDMLGDFAKQCNVGKRSMQQYRQVYRFRQNEPVFTLYQEQLQIPTPVLSWSHYRLAARIETLSQAVTFLNDCINNFWSVDEAEMHLPGKSGMVREKVFEFDYTFGYNSGFVIPITEDQYFKTNPETKYHVVVFVERPLK